MRRTNFFLCSTRQESKIWDFEDDFKPAIKTRKNEDKTQRQKRMKNVKYAVFFRSWRFGQNH